MEVPTGHPGPSAQLGAALNAVLDWWSHRTVVVGATLMMVTILGGSVFLFIFAGQCPVCPASHSHRQRGEYLDPRAFHVYMPSERWVDGANDCGGGGDDDDDGDDGKGLLDDGILMQSDSYSLGSPITGQSRSILCMILRRLDGGHDRGSASSARVSCFAAVAGSMIGPFFYAAAPAVVSCWKWC